MQHKVMGRKGESGKSTKFTNIRQEYGFHYSVATTINRFIIE